MAGLPDRVSRKRSTRGMTVSQNPAVVSEDGVSALAHARDERAQRAQKPLFTVIFTGWQ
jgi:hypothetical protein